MNILRRIEPFLPPLVGGLLIVVVLIGLIGTAIKNPQPHDIPVGLVGPAPAVQQISSSFATAAPGAFQFTTYASEQDARAALDARTVDGALVLGAGNPQLIVAGAAGDGAVGVITAAFTNVFQAQGKALAVETVHPFASGDAHGLILFFVVVATLISTLASQAILLTTSKAIGSVVGGLIRLLAAPGIGLAALLMVLSLVSSGGPVGSQLLPDFYRALAPWATAGELYGALRGALFFGGAALATPIAVLTGWLVVGVVLIGIGELAANRNRKAAVAG